MLSYCFYIYNIFRKPLTVFQVTHHSQNYSHYDPLNRMVINLNNVQRQYYNKSQIHTVNVGNILELKYNYMLPLKRIIPKVFIFFFEI